MASAQTGSSSQVLPSPWPADTMAPVGYLSRKALPIKRADAEPLSREDVQYDLLHHIFSNPKAVFTSATPGKTKKCSKVLKDKMKETPAFALELAKISLLTNVGRINTTMAFFPEMKTALRTYHPVPSLQKTDGNAQDAPRIKNCLKAALLPSEIRNMPPSTPEEILNKLRAGQKPPTSVVNLVFVLATHSAPLASVHFDGSFNFLDLFLPRNLSSSDRARTFLWLIYYYLEDPDPPNPFDDDYSRDNPDKAPLPRILSDEEVKEENIDSPEEVAWGIMMSTQRNAFLQKLVSTMEHDKKVRSSAPHFVPEPEAETSVAARRSRTRHGLETPKDEASFMYYVPSRESAPPGPLQKDPSPKLLPRGPREDRSMLQHAWHIMKNADPLVDSDEEFADEHTRTDYTRRLDVLASVQRTFLSSRSFLLAPDKHRANNALR
ncbi:Ino eighty subunit 1 [Pleurotus pulmonarius]